MIRTACTLLTILLLMAAPSFSQEPRSVLIGSQDTGSLLDLQITGFGLEYVTLKLTSKYPGALTVEVPVGVLLNPSDASVQTMIVRKSESIKLASVQASLEIKLQVACIQMSKEAPGEDHVFSVSASSAKPDLAALLSVPEFRDRPFRVQQFAIWTVTDDPERDDYSGIGSFVAIGPKPDEFDAIRALLVAASLDPQHYRAFQ